MDFSFHSFRFFFFFLFFWRQVEKNNKSIFRLSEGSYDLLASRRSVYSVQPTPAWALARAATGKEKRAKCVDVNNTHRSLQDLLPILVYHGDNDRVAYRTLKLIATLTLPSRLQVIFFLLFCDNYVDASRGVFSRVVTNSFCVCAV